jgi:hypothetical protein
VELNCTASCISCITLSAIGSGRYMGAVGTSWRVLCLTIGWLSCAWTAYVSAAANAACRYNQLCTCDAARLVKLVQQAGDARLRCIAPSRMHLWQLPVGVDTSFAVMCPRFSETGGFLTSSGDLSKAGVSKLPIQYSHAAGSILAQFALDVRMLNEESVISNFVTLAAAARQRTAQLCAPPHPLPLAPPQR